MSKVFLGDFIGGEFGSFGSVDGSWTNPSPADLEDIVFEGSYSFSSVDKACEAAHKAFGPWSELSLEARKNHILRLKESYKTHEKELAILISRETGKPLWETQGEAKALSSKIDITLDIALKLVEDVKVPEALPETPGCIRYKPRGVMAVLGPFNFPVHLPNGHLIPALVLGNTVVFKPSEKTPATGQWLAQRFQESGFPKGVFNLVHGFGETGRRLVQHEAVDGVLFTGSYDVGLKIKHQTLEQHGKLLALEMGGKNSVLVWKDADLEKAVYETLIGSYITCGQRCSCSSHIFIHKDVFGKFVEHFHASAKKLEIGYWEDNPFMGPLIDEAAQEKYIRFQSIAEREGAETLMRGKVLDLPRKGYYVTPSIYKVSAYSKDSLYQNTEIFGPNVALYMVEDLDESFRMMNGSDYGLAASVFSKNRDIYESAFQKLRVGLLNWNRPTSGSSSRLPFGGMGKSGNDRPTGLFAVQYCSFPVSTLEDSTPFQKEKTLKGTNYKPIL